MDILIKAKTEKKTEPEGQSHFPNLTLSVEIPNEMAEAFAILKDGC